MAGKLVHVEINAADGDRAHSRIARLLERGLQLLVHAARKGVQLVGPVERDRLDGPVAPDLDFRHRYVSSANSTPDNFQPRSITSRPAPMNCSLRTNSSNASLSANSNSA